ncbi:hypothetical protein E3H11_31150 [Bradyrhizobium brasilense]|uniref:HK97 family phage prohead protease n=1 Tax=Bradyrhizobium brasilense TaxID=1419277 RepID=UPI0014566B3C|nr:HK97 family phage prohead protease [Bradyrhizobium brasilense]NLS73286.1 hypothetical protein [Bradyrhizobium brasilense]
MNDDQQRLLRERFHGSVNRIQFGAADRARILREMGLPADTKIPPRPVIKFDTLTQAGGVIARHQLSLTASTATPDRSGDKIAQEAWSLDNYRKSGPLLWQHNSSLLPIGKCTSIGVIGGKLRATYELATEDENPEAERIRKLIAAGMVRGVSVGFKPGKWEFSKDKSRPDYSIDFTSGHELLEVSLCNIPCNPECLIDPPTQTGKSITALGDRAAADQRRRLELAAIKAGGGRRA